MSKAANYMKVEDCVERMVYALQARNIAFGVFCKPNEFIGIRYKFGNNFLATEYHYDTDESFGTACPLYTTGIRAPAEIPLEEFLGSVDKDTKRPVEFDTPVANGGRGWYYTDTNEADQNIHAVLINNDALYAFLKKIEAEETWKRK